MNNRPPLTTVHRDPEPPEQHGPPVTKELSIVLIILILFQSFLLRPNPFPRISHRKTSSINTQTTSRVHAYSGSTS